MDQIEVEFQEDGAFHDNLKAWAGKLIGQLLRIAGLLHVSYQAESCQDILDVDTSISKDTLAAAIKLKGYLVAHAEKAFGVMKRSQRYEDAEYILKLIRNKNKPIIEKQRIHQDSKKKFEGVERLNRALEILEYHSYIRQVIGGNFKKKRFVWVNPLVLEDKEGKKYSPNNPNKDKTVENNVLSEMGTEKLDVPNSPIISVNIDKKAQKKEEEKFPTKKTDSSNTENNLTESNSTLSPTNYKVVKY